MISKSCANIAHLNCGDEKCECTCHTWLPNAAPMIKAMLGNPPGMERRSK